MTIVKIILSLIAIGFGAFLVPFGEQDDSPGAQGLGVLLVITGVVVLYRMWRRNRAAKTQ